MFLQSSRQTAERNGNGHAEPPPPLELREAEFQRIKTGIHRELLDSLDLSRITGLSDEELREDIRRLAEGMLRSRSKKVPAIDEDRLVDELLAESCGQGPHDL
jgi:pilus assembly protein CpaF